MPPWTPLLDDGQGAVVLVRHGRTAHNHEGRFLGRTDAPLDEEGLSQVQRLAVWRGRFERVVSSPLIRARSTAAMLADELVVVDALAELDQGELEGQLVPDAVARYPDFFAAWARDPGSVRVPGGGRLDELRDGALAALHEVVLPGRAVAVVSHQLVLASVMATIDDAPLGRWGDYALPNAGAALLASDGDRFRLVECRLAVE